MVYPSCLTQCWRPLFRQYVDFSSSILDFIIQTSRYRELFLVLLVEILYRKHVSLISLFLSLKVFVVTSSLLRLKMVEVPEGNFCGLNSASFTSSRMTRLYVF